MYTYKPKKFYIIVFATTWFFWLFAILFNDGLINALCMVLGGICPATAAVITVFTSKSDALKKDFKRKIFNFWKLKPLYIFAAVLIFSAIVVCSILLSTVFGESIEQFSFTKDFSFTGVGVMSAFATIFLAAVLEEVGWRGYGEDAIAQYHSWFKESVIFGFVWACWHIPLFWIPGTYHYEIREMNILYMLNFLVSVVPMGFITTWVYVKNGRSMLSSIIFHLFINFMQEKIAMTQTTKCVETLVVFVAATFIVLTNRDMFFEKCHIGHILE
ncbi:MAG: type II CAAX endopeptidase family protein [Spirochaetales bacterium]|nr:type II CAAX endopeptidase family protein [Spirochaetales bacterium]